MTMAEESRKSIPDLVDNASECCEDGYDVEEGESVAAAWFRNSAEQGDANAQYVLGYLYANGHGVVKDEVEAVKWYRKAAEQGNALAQRNLEVMYASGYGVEKNEAKAQVWYRRAAELIMDFVNKLLKRVLSCFKL